MTKVLFDAAGNGLRFTPAAVAWLRARKLEKGGASPIIDLLVEVDDGSFVLPRYPMSARTDPDLIALFESLGNEACAADCELAIKEVPDGRAWKIYEIATFEYVSWDNEDRGSQTR